MPTVTTIWIMWMAEHLVESVPKINARPSEVAGQISQASCSIFRCGGIAYMENHAGCKRHGTILPVAFHRTVFAAPNDHVRNVLCIRNVARRKQPNFREGIESGGRP